MTALGFFSWNLLTFVIVSTVTPGPNNLMLMASGMNFGLRRTIPHLLGIGVGFMALNLAICLVLGQLIFTYVWVYYALLVASSIFVLWLAWKIANSGPISDVDSVAGGAKPISFWQAAAFQWVNPKAWAMAVAAAAAFLHQDAKLASAIVIAATFGLVNFPNGLCWTSFGMTLRKLISDPKTLRIFNITMAILLVLSFVVVLMGEDPKL